MSDGSKILIVNFGNTGYWELTLLFVNYKKKKKKSDFKCPIGKGSVETMSRYFLMTWTREMNNYTPTRVMSHWYFLEGDNVAYT